jgi:hypothetical protein
MLLSNLKEYNFLLPPYLLVVSIYRSEIILIPRISRCRREVQVNQSNPHGLPMMQSDALA